MAATGGLECHPIGVWVTVVSAFDRGFAPTASEYHPFGVWWRRDFGTCVDTNARGQGEMVVEKPL